MWTSSQIWMVLMICALTRGNKANQDVNNEFESRVATLEELLESQIKSQESLRETLLQETAIRRSLADQFKTYRTEQESKIDELTSSLKETHGKVLALEGMVQEQTRLREQAQLKAEMVLAEQNKRIDSVERDLSLLSLLNSRLRELERQNNVQNEEILNLQGILAQLKKFMSREKKDIQQLQSSIEPLAFMTSENTKALTDFDNNLGQLRTWFSSRNETWSTESVILRDVKNDVLGLTENMMAIEISIDNLTESVNHLHHITPIQSFKLCPEGFRKVGRDCLKLVETRQSWEMARVHCEVIGIQAGGIGDLAVPTSMPDFQAYIAKIKPDSIYLWVGAKRDEDHVWRWVTGTTMEDKNVPWDLGEPDNSHEQQQLCVRSDGNIKFHDCLDKSRIGSICQLT